MTRFATGEGGFDPGVVQRLGVSVTRLCADSRRIEPGVTFAAYPGDCRDGREFIPQAVERGAQAVLWEPAGYRWPDNFHLPNLGIARLRERIGSIASTVYGHPSEKLWVIGVTGTNGKTSCSHWLAQAFSGLGRKCALIGTLGSGLHGALQPVANTTPDAIELQAQMADYLEQGASTLALEVSSHGLVQGRVNGVHFDVALYTNLSRDHLDYHGDMESYAKAKAALFSIPGLRHAVLNLDDSAGVDLARSLRGRPLSRVGYSIQQAREARIAEDLCDTQVIASNIALSPSGTRFDVTSSWGSGVVSSRLLGQFNVSNLLGVLGCLLSSEVPFADALATLGQMAAPAGRMQFLGGGERPLAVVDYAHTPDALEKTLTALRQIVTPGARLTCVFGCGGDRDPGKRPLMGQVAARLADRVVVTSDNPRGENAGDIMDAIVGGMAKGYLRVESRAEAIALAFSDARAGDVILIAGKGHETYQEILGVRTPFSDVAQARLALGIE
jgi:UDP-N-acetylmuramoyl-L-alanyl-D-glutamate--2,6-diaminopimelate ligase